MEKQSMEKQPMVKWSWHNFTQLSTTQLYDLLKLRQDVFIIEQDCIYPDIDGLDQDCAHLLGYENDELVAYLRLIPAEFHPSSNLAFGRIISLAKKRGSGIGKLMMSEAMEHVATHFSQQNIQLAAQYYLQSFYEKFGFSRISEPYDEDGIKHIDMLYSTKAVNYSG